MSAVDELIGWFRELLEADEAEAYAILEPPPGHYDKGWQADKLREFAMRQLSEVEAKRRILDEHQRVELTYWPTSLCGVCADPEATPVDDPLGSDGPWVPNQAWPCRTVLAIAQPFASRSGWRAEWAVEPTQA